MSLPKKIQVNKKQKRHTREELLKLTKAELTDKVLQLQAYNIQLKNILQKKLSENEIKVEPALETFTGNAQAESAAQHEVTKLEKSNKKRKFDFSKSQKRHVLLKLLYFGWDYQGFACQEDSNATIEYHLFNALIRTCLIESRATSNYHRCGRTDKEVSAYCQVISIDLRSKFAVEEQLSAEALTNEIDYCDLLNRILPKNIQCIAWMPIRNSFYSARFDCAARTYRYYFPRGELNIQAMREACKLLEQHADFRNFCKMDVNNGVTNYKRNIQSATIQMCPNEVEDNTGYTMYFLEIKANAFLWHQIRCIMSILLLIGQENEEPNVISKLLDIETNPCKPQYTPSIGMPLNLFDCEFHKHSTMNNLSTGASTNNEEITAPAEFDEQSMHTSNEAAASIEADFTTWIYDAVNLTKLIEHVQAGWTEFSIKCSMIRNVLHNLESILMEKTTQTAKVKSQILLLQTDTVKTRQYQKLLNRKRCESLENRIEHYVKKQRLIIKHDDDDKTTA